MTLRLAEAEQLYEALQDPLLGPALEAFFRAEYAANMALLVQAVRSTERNTMKEAELAGKVEVFETIFSSLERFADEQMRAASQ